MADSDDEYDRKRRDKFRGERAADAAAYSNRGSERGAVRSTRDDWQERDGWSRPRPRDYPGRVRDRGYSPSIEPAIKRPRSDYYGGGGDYFGFTASTYHQTAVHRREIGANQVGAGDPGTGQPLMLSFKAFLVTQDDNISDSEAIEKYNDYKLEFQRQQLNEFFVAHKDDEWFRTKYHPEDSTKRKEEQTNFIKKRVEIFMDLYKEGRLSASIDCVQTNALVKLLDTVVIKLEGGTEEDIVALYKEHEEKDEPKLKDKEDKKVDSESKSVKEEESKDFNKEDGEEGEVDLEEDKKDINSNGEDNEKEKEEFNGEDTIMEENKDEDENKKTNEMNKRENRSESEEDNEREDQPQGTNKKEGEDEMDFEEKQPTKELKDTAGKEDLCSNVDQEKDEKGEAAAAVKVVKDKKRKRSRSYSGSSSSTSSSGSGSSSDSEYDIEKCRDKDNNDAVSSEKEKGIAKKSNGKSDENIDKDDGEKGDNKAEKEKLAENGRDSEDDKSKVVRIKEEDDKEKKEDKKPPPLHKTTSIFLRSLAPSITRQEVEAMCSRYAGFLRVALADPQPERRWQRRGWVTFRRDANIKEICWALNNARLRDCDLGAIMNRDLSRRIRPVSGIAAHKSVVRTDIRVAARVAVHMDGKFGLWKKDDDQDEGIAPKDYEEKFTPFGFLSHNPVLHNITDHLIEEASAEEDLLLGLEPSGGDDDVGSVDGTNVQIERDENLVMVLDRIILYLRIVHSIDYYNHCEYPNEDEMPSRCGILHARGPTPTVRADISHLIGVQAENRMVNFLPEVVSANDVLAQQSSKPVDTKKTDNEQKLIVLAMKDVDGEIDKFVQANTRELAKDKWLCPLSGKKFKGPDFVRKHIFNKHAEKIEEVKKEVEFFNNYLKDPKRPAAVEQHQQQQQQQANNKRDELPGNSSLGGGYHPQQHPRSYGGYGGGGYMGGGRYGGGGYGAYSRPHRGGYAHRARGGGGAGGGTDYRPIIHYRDLDAPREPEEFI